MTSSPGLGLVRVRPGTLPRSASWAVAPAAHRADANSNVIAASASNAIRPLRSPLAIFVHLAVEVGSESSPNPAAGNR